MLGFKQFEIRKGMKNMEHSDWFDDNTMLNCWNILKGRLEHSLGPAELVGGIDREDWRLVFHLGEFRDSLAPRQQRL